MEKRCNYYESVNGYVLWRCKSSPKSTWPMEENAKKIWEKISISAMFSSFNSLSSENYLAPKDDHQPLTSSLVDWGLPNSIFVSHKNYQFFRIYKFTDQSIYYWWLPKKILKNIPSWNIKFKLYKVGTFLPVIFSKVHIIPYVEIRQYLLPNSCLQYREKYHFIFSVARSNLRLE